MSYSLYTDIEPVLGPYIDTTNDLTTAEMTAYIAKVDGWIMDRLGSYFSPFNQTTDTPATPEVIQQVSRHWSIAECLRQLVGVNNQAAADLADRHQTIADTLLQAVMDRPETIAPETKTSETLAFGDGSPTWTLQTYQAFLASTSPIAAAGSWPPNIFPSSVRFSAVTGYTLADLQQMRYGQEYRIGYHEGYRKWVFEALEAALYDGSMTSIQVDYEWDYRKVRGTEPLPGGGGLVLVNQF